MNDEPEPILIPEWVVTFGDMMSLLLTFFIMLVSMSEIKQEDKYQALVDSMRTQFGYTRMMESMTPGEVKPRTSQFSVMSTMGRAKRKDTAKGGVPEKAPNGEETQVRNIRQGQTTGVGSVVFFKLPSADLDDVGKKVLDGVADQIRGKPQKVEIRGHSSPELTARVVDPDKAMLLGYQRAYNVMRYLIDEKGLPQTQFRISSAGDSEPLHTSGAAGVQQNPRVEVFLLDEQVAGFRGSAQERAEQSMTPTQEGANP